MDIVKKIYPSHEELQTVTTTVLCTEEGCSSVFSSESNLYLHLVKTHKKEWNPDSRCDKEYHCPNLTCIYNSAKNFKTLKLLKQHYLKVHGDKVFMCPKCNEGFATASSQNRHTNYCGISFKCCDCDSSYPCYESLVTHGRRKKHKILEKPLYNPNLPLLHKSNSGSDVVLLKKDSFILPKVSKSLHLSNAIPVVILSDSNCSIEKSSQTDCQKESPQFKTKETQISKVLHRWSSKHSQTIDLSKVLSSTETQTIGDYVNKKRKLTQVDCLYYDSAKTEDLALKSIKTQTQLVQSESKSCNTTFIMDESEYDPFIQRSSSSTQTVISTLPPDALYSTSTSTHDSIHTDTSDLNLLFIRSNSHTDLDDMTNFDSSSFLNCNMETQTDFMFDNDVLNEDYANMETQTIDSSTDIEDDSFASYDFYCKSSDDILLNTIHTQTLYDYLSCSVESQTMISHNKLQGGVIFRDIANIETQTDIDLKLLLESINA